MRLARTLAAIVKRGGTIAFATAVMAVLVVHETGLWTERFGPDNRPPVLAPAAAPAAAETALVTSLELPIVRSAVGTVRPRETIAVSPRIGAAVVELAVREGDRIEAGALVARLDDRDLRARVRAAEAAQAAAHAEVESARAQVARAAAWHARAAAESTRAVRLFEREAATQRELEQAQAGAAAAAAEERAAQAFVTAAESARAAAAALVDEAAIALAHAELRAPRAGLVAAVETELGELAAPGRAIVLLYDPAALRLEAALPESDALLVERGSRVRALVPALGIDAESEVELLDARADPASRTLTIEVALPPHPSLRSGLFGRVAYPAGTRTLLAVPRAAVRRAGQVETVLVQRADGRFLSRHVRTGAALEGELLEVLSGLSAGERVQLGEVQR